jgi:hypothetical protein
MDNIRAVDEKKRLQKYMSYVFEAEKEWMMIQKIQRSSDRDGRRLRREGMVR